MAVEPGWLLIVRGDRPDSVRELAARYPEATLIIDRRKGERRRGNGTVPPIERRERERRETLTRPDRVMWELLGYRLVYQLRPVAPADQLRVAEQPDRPLRVPA